MIRIEYDPKSDHSFALVSDYNKTIVDFCRAIKDTYGWKKFTWDIAAKRWRFSDPAIIRAFKDTFASLEIAPEVYAFFKEQKVANVSEEKRTEGLLALKQKTETDFRPQNLKELLRPYQNIGVEFAVASGGRAMINSGMGSGKSAQAIAFAAHMKIARTLVICPASVLWAWKNETERWTHLKAKVITSKSKQSDIKDGSANVLILNYEILKKFANTILECKPQLCICDEHHLIKNRKAGRTKIVKALLSHIPHVLFLSGTPFLNRPVELFTTLNMLDSRTWNDYYEFTRRYCDGKKGRWGWEAKGATNMEELRKKISKYFIRHLKEDVLRDLPPKVKTAIPVDLDEEATELYYQAENNLFEYLRETKGSEAAERAARAEAVVKLGALRQITTMGKLNAAKEIIENVIEEGSKIVVFSCYNEPLKQLYNEFPESVLMLGETPIEERQNMIDKFQNDPETKIFFGGMKVAGSGITLTAASSVLFCDLDFVPANHSQAEDRCHRLGTKHTVNVIQLFAKDTLDSYMMDLLKGKRDVFNYLIDGKDTTGNQTEFTMLSSLLDILRRKAEDRII